jgi:hypothetical protein
VIAILSSWGFGQLSIAASSTLPLLGEASPDTGAAE